MGLNYNKYINFGFFFIGVFGKYFDDFEEKEFFEEFRDEDF